MRILFQSSFYLLIVSLLVLGCRGELPSQNNTNNDDPVYPTQEFLYVGNLSRGEIYKIEIENEAIMDTLKGIESTITCAVTSRDGKKMYVGTYGGNPDAVFGYNLVDNSQFTVSYSTSHLYTSPEGDIIILSFIDNNTRAKVGTIYPQTDLVTYLDTLELKYSVFPSQKCAVDGNGKYLFASTNTGKLIKYNYSENRVERIYEGNYSLGCMVLSSNGNTLYSAAGSVIDLVSGDVIGEIPAIDYAHLAISPDDRFVYLTDPTGKNENGFFPTAKILVYETQSLSVTWQISVQGFVNYLSYTDEIAITSDGTKAYVSGFRDVFVIDLVNRRTESVIGFATAINPSALSIGKWIN